MKQKYSLKTKILAGLLCTAGLSLLTAVFGVWSLFRIEEKLKVVNMEYVPLLKVLGQLESHQYFLDHDLNDAFESHRTRIENFHAQAMENRIRSLARIYSDGERENPVILQDVSELERDFNGFLRAIDSALAFGANTKQQEDFSSTRMAFKNRLKKMMRDVEKGIHDMSLDVQHEISRSVSLVSGLLALFSLFSAGLVIWIDRLLKPLQKLTEIVKEISSRGLRESDRERMRGLKFSGGEIGVFSHEFNRMASSLLDRNRELEKQRKDLELAHEEMARQNDILRSTQARLIHEEKLGIVGRLSAQMAHEIRNPLNAISLHLETVEFDISSLSKDTDESIKCMKREIARLVEVTQSYLALARSPNMHFSKTNLNDVIREIEELYRPLLREKNVRWKSELSELPDFSIDRKNIVLVLGNLIKNAVEALSQESKSEACVRIISRYNHAKMKAELEFHDNGPGIDAKNTDSIFSPFFTTKASGTGLGLSHSKQIIDAHGGEIAFRSDESRGTSFYITLPIDRGPSA